MLLTTKVLPLYYHIWWPSPYPPAWGRGWWWATLYRSVATHLRCGGVVNKQFKTGLLLCLRVKKVYNRRIFGKVWQERDCLVYSLRLLAVQFRQRIGFRQMSSHVGWLAREVALFSFSVCRGAFVLCQLSILPSRFFPILVGNDKRLINTYNWPNYFLYCTVWQLLLRELISSHSKCIFGGMLPATVASAQRSSSDGVANCDRLTLELRTYSKWQ